MTNDEENAANVSTAPWWFWVFTATVIAVTAWVEWHSRSDSASGRHIIIQAIGLIGGLWGIIQRRQAAKRLGVSMDDIYMEQAGGPRKYLQQSYLASGLGLLTIAAPFFLRWILRSGGRSNADLAWEVLMVILIPAGLYMLHVARRARRAALQKLKEEESEAYEEIRPAPPPTDKLDTDLALMRSASFELCLTILERRRSDYDQLMRAFRARWEGELIKLPSKLRENKALMIRLLKQLPCLEVMDESIRSDRDCVLAAVTHWGRQLRFADARFRHDKEIVMSALESDIGSVQFIDSSLLGDKEIFMSAMRTEHDTSLTGQFDRCDWYDRTPSIFKTDEDVIALASKYRAWRQQAEKWRANRAAPSVALQR